MPAEADPGSTVVSGEGIELAAVGTTAQVVVKLEDRFGNPITDPGTSTVNVLFVNTVNSSATFPENSLPLELTWDPDLVGPARHCSPRHGCRLTQTQETWHPNALDDVVILGPGRYRSPRHRVPLSLMNEGSKCVG